MRRFAVTLMVLALQACRGSVPLAARDGAGVYAAILDASLFSQWGRAAQLADHRPWGIYLVNAVSQRHWDSTARSQEWLRTAIPRLPVSLIAAFAAQPQGPVIIASAPSARVPITLLAPEAFSAKQARGSALGIWLFRLARPVAFVQLSDIAWSPDRSEALVEISTFQGGFACGVIAWLHWGPNGWRIAGSTLSWIT